MSPNRPDFEPVPLRHRHDGWTAERQRNFIALLAAGWRPGRAAARVGMSRKSAYALRSRPGGEGFAALLRLLRRTARFAESDE